MSPLPLRSGGLPPFDITLMGWCAGSKESKKKPATDQSSVPQMTLRFELIVFVFGKKWRHVEGPV